MNKIIDIFDNLKNKNNKQESIKNFIKINYLILVKILDKKDYENFKNILWKTDIDELIDNEEFESIWKEKIQNKILEFDFIISYLSDLNIEYKQKFIYLTIILLFYKKYGLFLLHIFINFKLKFINNKELKEYLQIIYNFQYLDLKIKNNLLENIKNENIILNKLKLNKKSDHKTISNNFKLIDKNKLLNWNKYLNLKVNKVVKSERKSKLLKYLNLSKSQNKNKMYDDVNKNYQNLKKFKTTINNNKQEFDINILNHKISQIEFKNEQNINIKNDLNLDNNKFCYICNKEFSNNIFYLNFIKKKYLCNFFQKFICKNCSNNRPSEIPEKVKNNDLNKYHLSKKAYQIIIYEYNFPKIKIDKDSLLLDNEKIIKLIYYRKMIYLMNFFHEDKNIFSEKLKNKIYYLDNYEFFSMKEIIETINDDYLGDIKCLIKDLRKMFKENYNKLKIYCGICENDDYFIFDIKETKICKNCKNYYHKICIKEKGCIFCKFVGY